MKSFLLILTVLIAAPQSEARVLTDSLKYWVFFTDKEGADQLSSLTQPTTPTQRALQRRLLRGWHYEAETDVDKDVAQSYIDAVATVGIFPIVTSRWLNAISAFLTTDQVQAVRDLPFVRVVQPVAAADRHRISSADESSLYAMLNVAHASPLLAFRDGRKLDYGASISQLNLVNAITTIESGIDGAGVRLGIIDTEYGGFSHPAFDRLTSEGRLVEYRNFTGQSQSDRHGQWVASVMVGFSEGNLIGPAHGVHFLAATTEYAPTETNQEEDFFVAALEWMESEGVDVVNVSLSYTTFDPGQTDYTTADMDGDTGVTTRAADIAASLGVVVVVAAGNDGGCSNSTLCWDTVGTPADGDSVITVGGTFSSGNRVSSSSRGPTADGRIKPDVAAMGAGVVVADGADVYGTRSGTSLASPMVAAVACQILQVNPALAPMQVRDILRQTASQASAPDNNLGWGIIDAAAAVDLARGSVAVDLERPLVAHVDAYPNPFGNTVHFGVSVERGQQRAVVKVYDMLGREVATAFDGSLSAGRNSFSWHNASLASGVYVYELILGAQTMRGLLTRR